MSRCLPAGQQPCDVASCGPDGEHCAYEAAAVAQQANEARHGYARFLASKAQVHGNVGIDVEPDAINAKLFPFQRDLTRWALRKGRAALFADTGMGKTFMQLEWARALGIPTLIVAPLGVARQTVEEAAKLGLTVPYVRRQTDVGEASIAITNYEMIGAFDAALFGAVVLDESSILKAIDGKTRQRLTEVFAETPYRLCCTATPAPNDIAEIGNHAEFLGIMKQTDMLAAFFIHDASDVHEWRLKGHGREAFFRWLASWAMSIRKPSDLGYDDDGFVLPPLNVEPVWVDADYRPEGMLFSTGLKGVGHRGKVRRATMADRVEQAAALAQDGAQWIMWCGLNDEGRELAEALPDAVLVEGAHSREHKLDAIEGFQSGRYRILITKPKIAGFGMNFQGAHKMAFVGLSDSWEQYYQCIRRCWRYGQTQPVDVRVILSHDEAPIYENVLQKEEVASRMAQHLIQNVQQFELAELGERTSEFTYETDEASGNGYRLLLGDCVERLGELADNSIDLSVFSPPFLSLYTYSPTERDIGNSKVEAEFYQHFGYVIDHLLRVTKPGRNCAVHVSQVPATLVRDGYEGIKDFRGKTIDAFIEHGWRYHGEVCIDKDPQAQAIRTHSKGLLFVQLRRDASWLRPGLADYILVFKAPGKNAVPVKPDISNDEWIEWARPIWYGIRESDTLNVREARESDDERHIAPLQLGTIERCIRLWSNPGETVLSPFMGIGSEGYMALKLGREFVGVELKRSYYETALRNISRAREQQVLPL